MLFLDCVSKNIQIQNFMKIRPVGAELFHADGRTDKRIDMTKLTVAFRNFLTRLQTKIIICINNQHPLVEERRSSAKNMA